MFRDIVSNSGLVVANNGHHLSGPWGENTSITAQMRRARGIVTDGGARDANALVNMDFPTFCRYITPVFAQGRYRIRGYQKPIKVLGQVEEKVIVYPGDFVLTDRDSMVIVPAALNEKVLVAAGGPRRGL